MPDQNLLANQGGGAWRVWLAEEVKVATQQMAFGVLTSSATASQRLPLLRNWWLPGAVGCLSSDRHLHHGLFMSSVPRGLDYCPVPPALEHKHWMKAGRKGRGLHRGAIMPLILRKRFPSKQWYVVLDDDSMFNPLGFTQWVGNFPADEPWYLGGRSEDLRSRQNIGWDMAFGGAGIALSSGVFSGNGEASAFPLPKEEAARLSVHGARRWTFLIDCQRHMPARLPWRSALTRCSGQRGRGATGFSGDA